MNKEKKTKKINKKIVRQKLTRLDFENYLICNLIIKTIILHTIQKKVTKKQRNIFLKACQDLTKTYNKNIMSARAQRRSKKCKLKQ